MAPPRDDNTDDQARPRHRQGVIIISEGRIVARRPTTPRPQDRDQLALAAKETISVLPGLLLTRPDAKPDGYLYEKDAIDPLDPIFCPKLPKTAVRVISSDTIDAALQLARGPKDKPICILNMANAIHAGGGFKNGALAQEEALCYRSSLSFTLKLRLYPMDDKAAIYSPTVLVIRDSLANGHKLLDCRDPRQLPVISVVSAAAIFRPSVAHAVCKPRSDSYDYYSSRSERELMAEKMRIILRTAIKNRHRKIVLGAFGCGAFNNPPRDVSLLWRQVLQESEFSGGWWEEVVFAVLKLGNHDNNFGWFERALNGLLV